MKRVLGAMRRADEAFGLIDNGDKILIGLSGGKDSLVLLHGLSLYRRFSKKQYSLEAVMLGMYSEEPDLSALREFCARDEVPFTYVESNIARVVFEQRQEANPCSLCSRLRRASLMHEAVERGCGKVALGHHMDDAVETLFMNMIYEGRMATFSPRTYLDRSGITQIRPMVYACEQDIISAARRIDAPICKSPCPVNGVTKREDIKKLIASFQGLYPYAKDNIMNALRSTQSYSLWDKEDDAKPHL